MNTSHFIQHIIRLTDTNDAKPYKQHSTTILAYVVLTCFTASNCSCNCQLFLSFSTLLPTLLHSQYIMLGMYFQPSSKSLIWIVAFMFWSD